MRMSTSDLVRSLFGVRTQTRDDPPTNSVGVTAVRIARQNPNRTALIISNTGLTTIYVGLKNNVSTSYGIPVYSGGSISLNFNDDLMSVCNERWAISSAAGGTIYVEEVEIASGEEVRE